MPNKYYLREDRKAVKPDGEMFGRPLFMHDIQSLPALDVDPDYLKRLSTGWFDGEERYELCITNNGQDGWVQITKDNYDHLLESESLESSLRVTIVAPQEAEKGQEGDDIVDMIDKANAEINRSYEAYDKPLQISRVIGTIRVCDTTATQEHSVEWVRVEEVVAFQNFVGSLNKTGFPRNENGSMMSTWELYRYFQTYDRKDAFIKHAKDIAPQPVTGEAFSYKELRDAGNKYAEEKWKDDKDFDKREIASKDFFEGGIWLFDFLQAASRPSDAVASQEHREEVERLKARVKELEELLLEIDKSLYIGADLDDTEILKWYIDVVAVIKDQIKESVPLPTPPTK